MGVDLCQYGNHNIDFNINDLEGTATRIKSILDNIILKNEKYLKLLISLWVYCEHNDNAETARAKINSGFTEIENNWKEEWIYRIRTDDDYINIEFYGFYKFQLDFTKDKIYFWDPPYRFLGWFIMDKIVRDEWRKYMYQVIHP